MGSDKDEQFLPMNLLDSLCDGVYQIDQYFHEFSVEFINRSPFLTSGTRHAHAFQFLLFSDSIV